MNIEAECLILYKMVKQLTIDEISVYTIIEVIHKFLTIQNHSRNEVYVYEETFIKLPIKASSFPNSDNYICDNVLYAK